MKTIRLRVTLRDVEPRVLRILDVPADSTLGELHDLLQIGLGWLSLQPYQFISPALAPDLPGLGEHFTYHYDPEDRWRHDVTVLGPGGDAAGCVYGEGVCPPESSGGPAGYAKQTRNPFAAPDFDQDRTDLRVRQMAGRVPETVRRLIELTLPGVELTGSGALPEPVVHSMHALRPDWNAGAPATDEAGLPALLVLHGVLRSTGILWHGQGTVRAVAAAHDERFVVRRLRAWFEPGTFGAFVAGIAVGGLAAHGPLAEEALVHLVLGETSPRNPATADDVRQTLHQLGPVLSGLDLVRPTPAGWLPGPSARTLIPKATALAVRPCGAPGQLLTSQG
ncbi:plasmid pRiA4b ORF-3 family protein [Kineosporia sp. J2-2]|uniref:Plasmid pRiA4b ORF-3 family protein n=1 Tax=Kineosporia corallincola TaxID=2835133 RepID=A0ABS5TJC0_9ACTN|nr:plasmid pRiA4b ORF-3 family protein [Kineosporia corallincola]MBT0770933.1 plasmid pRiA4b ORF-3 family protein [Kineosporia corallincola]